MVTSSSVSRTRTIPTPVALTKINSLSTTLLCSLSSHRSEVPMVVAVVACRAMRRSTTLQPHSVSSEVEEWVATSAVVVFPVLEMAVTPARCRCRREAVMLIRSRSLVKATTMPIATPRLGSQAACLALFGDRIGIERHGYLSERVGDVITYLSLL